MYFVVKCLDFKIKDYASFNFICLYKRKGFFLLMSFAIPDLELDFNNVRNELPWELFDVINDTINKTLLFVQNMLLAIILPAIVKGA